MDNEVELVVRTDQRAAVVGLHVYTGKTVEHGPLRETLCCVVADLTALLQNVCAFWGQCQCIRAVALLFSEYSAVTGRPMCCV